MSRIALFLILLKLGQITSLFTLKLLNILTALCNLFVTVVVNRVWFLIHALPNYLDYVMDKVDVIFIDVSKSWLWWTIFYSANVRKLKQARCRIDESGFDIWLEDGGVK